MGRVASKRKLKQCDPFFKGKREGGKKAKAYDLPPVQSKRSKKRQRKALDEEAIERFVLKTSAVNDDGTSANGKTTNKNKLEIGTIREGETMKEFNKRINTEVKRVIYEETKKTKRKSEKRKEFLGKKKEKEKMRKMTDQERYEAEFQATGVVNKDTFEGTEKVRFGDRVDAPPVLPKLKGIFLKRAQAAEAKKAGGAKKARK